MRRGVKCRLLQPGDSGREIEQALEGGSFQKRQRPDDRDSPCPRCIIRLRVVRQQRVSAEFLTQEDRFAFAVSQVGQGRIGRLLGTLDRTLSRRSANPLPDELRCAGVAEFPDDGLGNHHLAMQAWEHIDVPDEDQVIDWRRIGDDHH